MTISCICPTCARIDRNIRNTWLFVWGVPAVGIVLAVAGIFALFWSLSVACVAAGAGPEICGL